MALGDRVAGTPSDEHKDSLGDMMSHRLPRGCPLPYQHVPQLLLSQPSTRPSLEMADQSTGPSPHHPHTDKLVPS